MDAENDNEQPNSSSASSSNNSSSSNLLVNLPMLPILHSQDDDEEFEEHGEEHIPLHPPSPPALGDIQAHPQSQPSDNSVFISPLQFNNNSTPPPSSSSSSSSSSSHNLHLYHHHQHSEHSHHQQHTPPPSSHQQHAPPSPPPQEPQLEPVQQQQQNNDDNAIADTIDASAVEDDDDVNLNADIASTSQQQQPRQQQQQQQPQQSLPTGGSSSGVAALSEPHTPPASLPLLLEEEANNSYPSHFLQPYAHLHQHHHTSFGSCSNIFGFDATKSNGAVMFGNNDTVGHLSSGAGGGSHHHQQHHHQMVDRLKVLYPNVNENETPLPRCWSPHDKCLSIGLSQNNLRVHYKGVGKQHNDAASVRTTYPIPAACGLYYFEVKIISKGKNGYMGIGLTAEQFRMNRLPGWDKQSYGYHGDDGNSFSSSGKGQSYGPTFTTGDVIGCCVNFVNNTCFYTKNGIDLGIAFRDLPTKLYPTVGLQTPGEEVDANFGQEPFKFDQIEDMMKQMRAEMKTAIYDFPMPADRADPTTLLHKMVSSYLVHNGYSQTAEAFARTTGQSYREDLSSIRNRQKILKLVMSGKMGQAIEHTLRSYPGLLESNKNLWFMLKCRQFIEMVNGSDIETSVIQSTKSYQNGKSSATANKAQNTTATSTTETTTTPTTNPAVINADNNNQHEQDLKNLPASVVNSSPAAAGDELVNIANSKNIDILVGNMEYLNDVEMENNGHTINGNSCKNGNSTNFNDSIDVDEEMDIDLSPSTRKYSHGIERILEFGKELSQMGQQLEKENKMNDEDRQMLEDAFSLIAYSNPWSSPLGWQLCPTKRETVCTALNSAILEFLSYPGRPPLDVCVAHASELLKVMAQASLGACAFVNIDDIFPQN